MSGVGVLLMAFGGPDSPEAIEPFLSNLLGGRPVPAALLAAVKERYARVGGKSPLPGIVARQARALAGFLRSEGDELPVYTGMAYWHPYVGETIETMYRDGIRRVVAVGLSPHFSRVSAGAYTRQAEEVRARFSAESRPFELVLTPGYFDHPLYLDALAEKLSDGLAAIPAGDRDDTGVVFTAHNLPAELVDTGDPYVDQLKKTVAGLLERVPVPFWRLAFQSKGAGRGEWLKPEVEEVIGDLAAAGRRRALVDPVGFTCDHMETLYDIDVALAGLAADLGLKLTRCGCLNDSPRFIRLLAAVVRSVLVP